MTYKNGAVSSPPQHRFYLSLKFLKIPKKLFSKSFFGGVKGQSPLDIVPLVLLPHSTEIT